MDRLINDLLEFSRLKNARLQLERVSLEEVISECLEKAAERIRSTNAKVKVEKPLPIVLAHQAALVQAMFNLVENAVKYTEPGTDPLITISAKNNGDRVVVSVADRGLLF